MGLPEDGFDVALFLTGRRSGKSKISAIIGAYEVALSGREKSLAKGEMGMVAIIVIAGIKSIHKHLLRDKIVCL